MSVMLMMTIDDDCESFFVVVDFFDFDINTSKI